MKKIVFGMIIVAIVVAASSVQAVTVIEKDNFTYKIKGDLQIQFRQDPGTDQDPDVEYDDLEIKNSVEYKLNDTMKAFGQLDFGFKNAADKSDDDEGPHLEEAYVGLKINSVKLHIGKSDSAGDIFGIQGAKEAIVAEDVFDEVGATEGDDIIAISADLGKIISVYATHEVEAASEKSDENGTFTDIIVTAKINNLSLGAALQTIEAFGSDDDTSLWGVQVSFDTKVAEVSADYSSAEDQMSIWNICIAVPVKPVTLGAGFVSLDPDDNTQDTINGWWANVIYKFPSAENVRLFAEISDSDEDNSDMGYMFGIRFKF